MPIAPFPSAPPYPVRERAGLIRTCAWGAAILSLASLEAWLIGNRHVLSFVHSAPIAPSSALVILLLSIVLWLQKDGRQPHDRAFTCFVWLCAAVAMPIALSVVYANVRRVLPSLEVPQVLAVFLLLTGFSLRALGRRRNQQIEQQRLHMEMESNMERALAKEREASHMKGRFISVTSHEFRTPITAALGSVELLVNHMDRLTPEKRAAIVLRIRDSLLNMEVLVREILTLSRAESGRQKLQIEELDLAGLATEVVEEARAADKESHVFELTTCPGAVQTDRNLLRHVMTNLVSNAVRYSKTGTRISVSLERTPDAYRVIVQDHGIGIPAADRERIFEPFERGTNVGTIRGTGLGLNIVKRMTEMLGGQISLDSVENQGSTFAVEFPRPVPVGTCAIQSSPLESI